MTFRFILPMATSLQRRESFLKTSSAGGFWYYYWKCRGKGDRHFLRGVTQCGGKDGTHLGEGKVPPFGWKMPPHLGGKCHPIWMENATPFGGKYPPFRGGESAPIRGGKCHPIWGEVCPIWGEKCLPFAPNFDGESGALCTHFGRGVSTILEGPMCPIGQGAGG